MKNLTEHTVNFRGSILLVHGTYYNGSMGDLETPPEPEQFEIEKVSIGNDLYAFDVTELCEEFMDEIEQQILNERYR
jgi:hypothetical protein